MAKRTQNVKEVRSNLGVLDIKDHSSEGCTHCKPLTELTKETKPLNGHKSAETHLDKLIRIVTSEPVLACPDLDKPFELEVDASAYAVGAKLFQRDENKRRRDVGYFSKASLPRTNYDVLQDRGL